MTVSFDKISLTIKQIELSILGSFIFVPGLLYAIFISPPTNLKNTEPLDSRSATVVNVLRVIKELLNKKKYSLSY